MLSSKQCEKLVMMKTLKTIEMQLSAIVDMHLVFEAYCAGRLQNETSFIYFTVSLWKEDTN